jgi:hypothetical protein
MSSRGVPPPSDGRGVPPPSDGKGVPPPSDGSYARLVGGVAVKLDRRSELTAVVYGRGRGRGYTMGYTNRRPYSLLARFASRASPVKSYGGYAVSGLGGLGVQRRKIRP